MNYHVQRDSQYVSADELGNLAIGKITTTLILRTPDQRLWILEAPNEIIPSIYPEPTK